ncbi:small membrane protein YoaI [Escherichia albertii]|nr:small membrane protein YoaI [Escherichia albertii]
MNDQMFVETLIITSSFLTIAFVLVGDAANLLI